MSSYPHPVRPGRSWSAIRALAAAFAACLLTGAPRTVAAQTVPAGFNRSTHASGLIAPTRMAFAPDGRLFVCEQGGVVRIIKNGVVLPNPFLSLDVNDTGERGLLGIALDPNFETNSFVYLYYTARTPTIHNRVSRFTASGDTAAPGTEQALLDLEPLGASNHNGGDIQFGPDGKLYIATGENAVPANAQNLGNRLGKVLRIDTDGSIPKDNPFFGVATGDNRSIWALGLRNPFSFTFERGTGLMAINDVGQSSFEEVNEGIPGANYGWPVTEGPTSDPRYRAPVHSYGHGSGDTRGCAITGGEFYNPATVQFPPQFQHTYFYADLCNGWIRYLSPDGATSTLFGTGFNSIVDITVGPEGALYLLSYQAGSVIRVDAVPTGAPSGLAATQVTPGGARLDWTDNSANETGFRIEVKQGRAAFKSAGTVAAGVTTVTLARLKEKTAYTVRVVALLPGGASPPSNEVTFTTPAAGRIQVTPAAVNLVRRPSDTAPTRKTIRIKNGGGGVLKGSVGAPPVGFVVVSGGGEFTLDRGQMREVVLEFQPPQPGMTLTGTLPITSDDPKKPLVNVKVKGKS